MRDLYGYMKSSFFIASFGVTTIACWEQYLRIPPGPWREPRPEALAPPIGSSSTV